MKKDKALKIIEDHRKEMGLSVFAASKVGLVAQSQWDRFARGEREPTWDKLILMAESVGLKIEITIKED
jgi:hypothetical protein